MVICICKIIRRIFMCDILREVYRSVYNESFEFAELDKRIKLQKAVYLLENMGVSVGDYSFSWNKYGPYSIALDVDAQKCDANKTEEIEVEFSDIAKKGIDIIRGYLEQKGRYSCAEWVECIASLHYLSNVWRYDKMSLLEKLREFKPYLKCGRENKIALNIVDNISVVF